MSKRLFNDAKVQTRAIAVLAGYNLFSAQELELKPNSVELVKTDIVLNIPRIHYGRIALRSSWELDA